MVFINFSSDQVLFDSWSKKDIIDNKSIEINLPKYLVNFYKKQKKSDFYFLNWPGWFTTLRLACLCFNVLNFSQRYKLNFYTISKLDFYKILVEYWILPYKGILFIGQKKKCWIFDFHTKEYIVTNFTNFKDNLDTGEYFVDQLVWDFRQFFPEEKIVDFSFSSNNILFVEHNGISQEIELEKTSFEKTQILHPNYVVSPNICMKK